MSRLRRNKQIKGDVIDRLRVAPQISEEILDPLAWKSCSPIVSVGDDERMTRMFVEPSGPPASN
jgi:hypothetical protein